MIALVRGEVVERGPDHVTLLCGGVGYRLAASAQTLAAVGPPGSEATLHSHLIVRDDALTLVGFAEPSERDLFLALIGVQAVGPKLALAVLGAGPARSVLAAIAAGDARFFCTVPGVGRRTAERIIVELRDKVGAAVGDELVVRRGSGSRETPHQLARDGLLELGFAAPEAERLLAGADGDSAEELLAAALRATRRGGAP
jgi:Holliday junction DNA helicase RuvA